MSVLAPEGARGNGRPALPGDAIPPVELDHEELVVRRGRRSGLPMIVAVHSTALGPSLGGVRMWRYRSSADGARDALRLARAMTFKAAAAGLELGGGKGVICVGEEPLRGDERRDALHDFGDLVESLEGRYVAAEDVGTSPTDLVTIRERTAHVAGLPAEHGGSGDPSPCTARGVEAAMHACAAERFGSRELHELVVVVIGLGHVGGRLARRLAGQGGRLIVSDIDRAKRSFAEELGAEWAAPEDVKFRKCEILAPCALGGAIDAANLQRLRCEIVCGSANNQLADETLAAQLERRGILYAPDFIVNAGGLISVYREVCDYGAEEALELVDGIEAVMRRILRVAREHSITPLDAARELALERLGRSRDSARPLAAA